MKTSHRNLWFKIAAVYFMESTGLVAQNQAAVFEGLKDLVNELWANKGYSKLTLTQPFHGGINTFAEIVLQSVNEFTNETFFNCMTLLLNGSLHGRYKTQVIGHRSLFYQYRKYPKHLKCHYDQIFTSCRSLKLGTLIVLQETHLRDRKSVV